MSYCQAILNMSGEREKLHRAYHDQLYGFPIIDDNELFGRLVLEINQAGLSWETILKKENIFRKAYHNFNVKKVASYKETDRQRLLNDAGIIRNRLKIDAAIHNANVILQMQKEHGSFLNWLNFYHPLTKDEWIKLFKCNFKFTGDEIVNEFLMSIGFLKGAHEEKCSVYKKILTTKPAWQKSE